MKKTFSAFSIISLLVAGSPAAAAPLYTLVQTVPLSGPMKWDYLQFDAASHRVYISHGTELTVLDARTGAVTGHVLGLTGSHGIAIDSAAGEGYADSGKTQSISVFDLKTLQTTKTIPALLDADGMVFDAPSNQVFTVGGDANAALAVDATTHAKKASIPLGGAPEFLVSDNAGSIYVNINDKNEIAKIDTKTDVVTAHWPLPGCTGPTGLAIDTAHRILFSSCDNAVMSVVSADTGAVLATLPIGNGTDSAAFDPVRKLAFSPNRDGTLSIIHEVGAGKFEALPPVRTQLGARTIALDPASGKIYLVTAKVIGTTPPDQPGDHPHLVFAPGTLHVLIYAPAN